MLDKRFWLKNIVAAVSPTEGTKIAQKCSVTINQLANNFDRNLRALLQCSPVCQSEVQRFKATEGQCNSKHKAISTLIPMKFCKLENAL